MRIDKYDRESAVKYAHRYALGRNSKYYDFSKVGGDCTNFISQCIFSGSKIMNYQYPLGWYYKNVNDRAPAWTGVQELYNFLTSNKNEGPFASECNISELMQGDIVQLKFQGNPKFSHSLMIVAIFGSPSHSTILTATHTEDSDNRPIDSYTFEKIRYLHIDGVRKF